MTHPGSISDAVLFLSPARRRSGLPPEVEGRSRTSPVERMSIRLRREGISRLRLVALAEDQLEHLQPEQFHARLQELGDTFAAAGIALHPETAPTLELWLAAQPPDQDWVVCGPEPTDSAPEPQGAEDAGVLWLERMRCGTGLGMLLADGTAPVGPEPVRA